MKDDCSGGSTLEAVFDGVVISRRISAAATADP